MKLEVLQTFIRLAELKNFSATAKTLQLTQPGITKQIQLLEEEIGTQLFVRSRAQVELTEAGAKFHRQLVPLHHELTQLFAETRSASREIKGQVTIGSLREVGQSLLMPRILKIMREHPGLELTVEFAITDDIISRVKSGKIGLGIIGREVIEEGVRCYAWEDEECVLVTRTKNPRADSFKNTGGGKFSEIPCVSHGVADPLLALFERELRKDKGLSKVKLMSKFAVNSHQSMLECLLNTDYFCVLPRHIAAPIQKKNIIRQVGGTVLRNRLYLIHLEQKVFPRKYQVLLKGIRSEI